MQDPTVADGWRSQLRKNFLSLLSLLVALSALSYNTWRNESTERNRNIRAAEFEMLRHLIEVQQIIDRSAHPAGSDLNTGLNRVLLIHDLAQLTPPPVTQAAEQLRSTWVSQSEALAQYASKPEAAKAASDHLSEQVWQTRQSVLASLRSLH